MSFRHLYIAGNSDLRIRQKQLVINKDEEYTIPLDDIATIMLANRAVTITSVTLSMIAEYNIALFTCDEKHLPNGLLTSFNSHSRQLKNVKLQLEMSKPFQKKIWQNIVRQKIKNQAKCLQLLGIKGFEILYSISEKVESGDSKNTEGYASAYYFKSLFGINFSRGNEDTINSALNYGYSLMRGLVARSICVYGFIPCIGLFHHNELNNFNLADDLIEPLRPIIDLYVASNINNENMELESRHKFELYNLLNACVLVNKARFSVTSAVDTMISSFVNSIKNKKHENMKLPEICSLEQQIDYD